MRICLRSCGATRLAIHIATCRSVRLSGWSPGFQDAMPVSTGLSKAVARLGLVPVDLIGRVVHESVKLWGVWGVVQHNTRAPA
jgi:hypothetical protein